jgi:membrane-bound ClpP family serine protease
VSTATLLFLCIGALGILIAAVAILGAEFLDFGDGLFSTEVVAAMVGGFGFGAAAANELLGDDAATATVLALGVVISLPITLLAWLLTSRVRNMRTDATPTRADLVGTTGIVVTPVPLGGYGEVRVRIGGQPVKLNARAELPVALGAKVVVLEAPSDTSVIVKELL